MSRKFVALIGTFCLVISVLTGCGADDDEETSYAESAISIDKKGRISEEIVESFDKDYYDLDELEDEFESSVSEVNDSCGDQSSVQLKDIYVKDGDVYVFIKYKDAAGYEALSGQTLFYGTINDAYDAGYSMSVTLKSTTDSSKIGKVEIMGMKDKHIIILSEPVRVNAYTGISYVSANVEMINDTDARVLSEAGGLAYLILDK